jgi:hypothetical protein
MTRKSAEYWNPANQLTVDPAIASIEKAQATARLHASMGKPCKPNSVSRWGQAAKLAYGDAYYAAKLAA